MEEQRPPGCEHCKKNCTVHLTQIIEGKVHKVDMCDTCPKAQMMQDPMEFGLMEQLLGVAMQKGLPGAGKIIQQPKCDRCGYTEADFKKTGRLGCSHCYEAFISHKADILLKIHDATLHQGKCPKKIADKGIRNELARLNKELQAHILAEAFEQAASVRDKIQKLKEQLKSKM